MKASKNNFKNIIIFTLTVLLIAAVILILYLFFKKDIGFTKDVNKDIFSSEQHVEEEKIIRTTEESHQKKTETTQGNEESIVISTESNNSVHISNRPKIYKNKEYGFSFEYSNNLVPEEREPGGVDGAEMKMIMFGYQNLNGGIFSPNLNNSIIIYEDNGKSDKRDELLNLSGENAVLMVGPHKFYCYLSCEKANLLTIFKPTYIMQIHNPYKPFSAPLNENIDFSTLEFIEN